MWIISFFSHVLASEKRMKYDKWRWKLYFQRIWCILLLRPELGHYWLILASPRKEGCDVTSRCVLSMPYVFSNEHLCILATLLPVWTWDICGEQLTGHKLHIWIYSIKYIKYLYEYIVWTNLILIFKSWIKCAANYGDYSRYQTF